MGLSDKNRTTNNFWKSRFGGFQRRNAKFPGPGPPNFVGQNTQSSKRRKARGFLYYASKKSFLGFAAGAAQPIRIFFNKMLAQKRESSPLREPNTHSSGAAPRELGAGARPASTSPAARPAGPRGTRCAGAENGRPRRRTRSAAGRLGDNRMQKMSDKIGMQKMSDIGVG